MSARSLTTVVTADTMALNAVMFGFGGHSVLTPHQAIQSVWWTDERIEAKVTREFVASKLRPSEREQLFQPMFGGSGLTEDTYLDWVLGRAKRIFLILVECNCSDQIFGIAEDAWDDDDLPIPLSEIPRLALSYKDDESLNKRFYNNQFQFLLRPLNLHGHIDYAPNEVVPTEYVHKMAPSAALQKWSRFHLPKMPTLIYAKRKVVLGEKGEMKPEMLEKFLEDVQVARSVEHDHIAPIMASWSHKGNGYVMTSLVGEHTLRSFIDFRTPSSLQKASKQERQKIPLQWLHCLACATAYLHQKRIAHSAICPSNIVIDEHNSIAFSDLGFLETFQKDKKLDVDELYNYGAPEQFEGSRETNAEDKPQPVPSKKFLRRRRKSNDSGRSGSDKSSQKASNKPQLVWDMEKANYVPVKTRSNSEATITPLNSNVSTRSVNKPHDSVISAGFDPRASISSKAGTIATTNTSTSRSTDYEADRRASDIYSLSCVFLDIITFVLKHKPQDFSKHRSTKYKNTKGRGTHMDTSFHNNAQKVQTWMEILEHEVTAQPFQDQALYALPPLFRLIAEMQNPDPQCRPSAADVQDRVYDALYNFGGMQDLHCLNTGDLRPPSTTLSFARTSTSGSSSNRTSSSAFLISGPQLAAFPEIEALVPPPIPEKSARRPRATSSSSVTPPASASASRPATPRRAGTGISDVPPVPPLSLKNSSKLDLRHWGRHRKASSNESGRTIGVSS